MVVCVSLFVQADVTESMENLSVTPPAAPGPGDEIGKQIETTGLAIRDAKTNKATKEEIKAMVGQLLALKADYKQLTGNDFQSAGQKAPKKGNQEKQGKGDKKPKEKKTEKKEAPAAGSCEEGSIDEQDQALLARLEAGGPGAGTKDAEGQTVTPWDVEAEGGVDYDKLIRDFGSSKINQTLIQVRVSCRRTVAGSFVRGTDPCRAALAPALRVVNCWTPTDC